MKLIFIISSTGRGEYTIARNPHTITVSVYENEKAITEVLQFLTHMNYPLTSIDVVHYENENHYVNIIELKERIKHALDITEGKSVKTVQAGNAIGRSVFSAKQESASLTDEDQMFVESLQEYMRENPHPDFKSAKLKDIKKCNNYITSVLGLHGAEHSQLDRIRRCVASL